MDTVIQDMKNWGPIAAAAISLLAAGARAQTGSLLDLGDTLSQQKNLTTFYKLIQVRSLFFSRRDFGQSYDRHGRG